MAGQYVFAPKDDDAIIRHRLMTRVSVTRGEPPMKKLVKKLLSLAAEACKDDGDDDAAGDDEDEAGVVKGTSGEDAGVPTEEAFRNADKSMSECEKAAKAFLLELAAFEQPLLKTRAVIGANRRDQQRFRDLQGELEQQIENAKDEIAHLKVKLEEAKEYRRQEEECELVRHQISQHPPRSESQAAITALEKDLEALERENLAASRVLDLRRKQFSLLLHTIDDLQQVLEESTDVENEASKSALPSATFHQLRNKSPGERAASSTPEHHTHGGMQLD